MSNDKTSKVKATEDKGNGVSAKTLLLVSLGLLVVYVIAVGILYFRAETASADAWTRYIVLLTGVESLVFAAIGWLFGREVNRQRAEAAEDDKDKAQKKAAEAEAASGKTVSELHVAQEQGRLLQGAIEDLNAAKDSIATNSYLAFAAAEGADGATSVEKTGISAQADLSIRIEALENLAKRMQF